MADTLKPTPESKKTETKPAATTPDMTAATTPSAEPTVVAGSSATTPESTASVPTAETESPSTEAPQTQQSADIEFFLLKWLRSLYNLIMSFFGRSPEETLDGNVSQPTGAEKQADKRKAKSLISDASSFSPGEELLPEDEEGAEEVPEEESPKETTEVVTEGIERELTEENTKDLKKVRLPFSKKEVVIDKTTSQTVTRLGKDGSPLEYGLIVSPKGKLTSEEKAYNASMKNTSFSVSTWSSYLGGDFREVFTTSRRYAKLGGEDITMFWAADTVSKNATLKDNDCVFCLTKDAYNRLVQQNIISEAGEPIGDTGTCWKKDDSGRYWLFVDGEKAGSNNLASFNENAYVQVGDGTYMRMQPGTHVLGIGSTPELLVREEDLPADAEIVNKKIPLKKKEPTASMTASLSRSSDKKVEADSKKDVAVKPGEKTR